MSVLDVVPYVIVGGVIVSLIMNVLAKIKRDKIVHFQNDLSNDYKRWDTAQMLVCAYVSVNVDKSVRLDDTFQAVLYAILKKSPRAVNEKIRRISTIGTPKSDASEADVDAAYHIAQMTPEDAYGAFFCNLYTIGATPKQVSVLKSFQ